MVKNGDDVGNWAAGRPFFEGLWGLGWVLPPLSNSWIILIIWLYITLKRTPNIDCYWAGGST